MKTLYLVRHAKSSWDSPGMTDWERPLLEKGKKRTKRVIDQLIKQNIKIDLILSSPAVRALETAKILAHALCGPSWEISIGNNLYTADAEDYFDLFFDIPAGINSLMVVGHNPAITNFANLFMDSPIDYLPTSGVVSIYFKSDNWDFLQQAPYKVNFIIFPKMLE